jgi:5-methyltetrahydrofolate--homocysteine methyltransferase
METKVTSINQEVIISSERPTILIGERINPTGRKRLSASLLRGDMEIICQEAISQVEAGADILDVNVGASGVDEVTMLPKAVRAVMGVVDAPLSLDSDNPKAIAAALKVYKGKPIINSVTGQESSLNSILPLVKEYCASVIGLTMDEDGIPTDATRRLEIAKRIVDRAERLKIPREDVIIDCLVTTVSTDDRTAAVTLEAIRKVSVELNVNQTIGTSNISFGLPERETLNTAFLVLAIGSGVTCPCANVAKVRQSVLATDLLLGKDPYSSRYIKGYRQMPSRGK